MMATQLREKACQADLSLGKYRSSGCFSLLDAVLDASGSQAAGKMTMYDSRLFSKVAGFYPPGHQDVEVRQPCTALYYTVLAGGYLECSGVSFLYCIQ
jgi:hypothetical protein